MVQAKSWFPARQDAKEPPSSYRSLPPTRSGSLLPPSNSRQGSRTDKKAGLGLFKLPRAGASRLLGNSNTPPSGVGLELLAGFGGQNIIISCTTACSRSKESGSNPASVVAFSSGRGQRRGDPAGAAAASDMFKVRAWSRVTAVISPSQTTGAFPTLPWDLWGSDSAPPRLCPPPGWLSPGPAIHSLPGTSTCEVEAWNPRWVGWALE